METVAVADRHTEVALAQSEAEVTSSGEVDDRPVKSEIIKGWFNEWIDVSCGGHAMCLKVDEILFHEKSPFQDILIFKRLSSHSEY